MQSKSNHHPSRICRPNFLYREVPAIPPERAFDIHSLGSDILMKLFHEANSLISAIWIEIVPGSRGDRTGERHPAATIGLPLGTPTIQFTGSLNRISRIEAIAHELVHLLLVYRHGWGVIGLRIPPFGDGQDIFNFFMNIRGDWNYLLGQIVNTVHHLILIDYLREEYGIESGLHLHLLQQNFRITANETWRDKESLYAKGLIAFEYERLIGDMDRGIIVSRQAEPFWKAYHMAQEHFGKYSFRSISTPSVYEENIFSFLEDLGYRREDFVFFTMPDRL
jgi:hypothetical protein